MLEGPLLVALIIALAAGVVSFLSPCVLPLVPGYLGLLGSLSGPSATAASVASTAPAGTSGARTARPGSEGIPEGGANPARGGSAMRRTLVGVTLFILGFTAVFVAMNAVVGGIGTFFIQYRDPVLRILGIVMLLAGLIFIGRVSFLQRVWKPKVSDASSLWSAPVIGAAFAIGWTPCSGPVLAAIGALSISSGSAWQGALFGLMYGLGLGIPFIAMAIGFGWATKSASWVKRHMRMFNMVGGSVLIAVGLLMITGLWMMIMDALAIWIGSVTTVL
ncbi:MAG TPA: cytochrome c biogenesis protein CcdA [Candidatus Agrococcus pullicola]|uniref:Cytochrome c biogenesis protein CcdA n=1 Tax=Candidatus Agrococcus pullicola TaxID=2838429 RepID=A0A9D2C8C0_9MICO|nr:cytochrome c biogenesis protein CcdA [Candidatus Agrococcus pullicola]